jgi:hypothetical protein
VTVARLLVGLALANLAILVLQLVHVLLAGPAGR